jgi:hypothetical protein
MSNKLTEMARELLAIEADLPYRLDYTENPRPYIDDFELHTFTQLWGSTALGFGGIDGQAMTETRTYVFIPVSCNQKCFVYFGGRFAYKADYCENLKEDIRKQNMASVSMAGKYKNKDSK